MTTCQLSNGYVVLWICDDMLMLVGIGVFGHLCRV